MAFTFANNTTSADDTAAAAATLKFLEHLTVSPPPSSVSTTCLPLTFFDIPWLLFPPAHSLFFYDSPHSTLSFTNTLLPSLKHSLSITLQHFFPFAGALALSPPPHHPKILYTNGDSDSVSLTLAESDGDFAQLCGYHPRPAQEFSFLAPQLEETVLTNEEAEEEGQRLLPLLAVQVTVFPNSGFCIGFSYRHVVGDWRTFDHFVKSWASICSTGKSVEPFPCYDRSLIREPFGVKEGFIKEWRELKGFRPRVTPTGELVRATFVVGRREMDKIKQSILRKYQNSNSNQNQNQKSLLLSPYVVTCAFVWVCLAKARGGGDDVDGEFDFEPSYFGFVAGGITRLDYQVPTNYFGNCVGFGRTMVTKGELLGEDGLLMAAKAIGEKIKELNEDVLGRAGKWVLDWKVLFGSELHLPVSGSPKVDLYGLDFGLGRPRKIEDISIDKTGGISLIGGRNSDGEIEVGLSLPKVEMDSFSSTFRKNLHLLS